MAITPIQNFISALSNKQPAVSIVSASGSAASASVPASSASVSSTPAPLLAAASLQNTAVGLAQLSSLLDEAQSGTQQVGSILQKLQSLAGEAELGGPPSALASLDSEFQQLLSQINQVTSNTTFGGASLLDGSLSGQGTDSNNSVSVPNLSTQGLFDGASPNVLDVNSASEALAAIARAQNIVGNTNDSLEAAQTEVTQTSATVSVALANNSAATSTLTESDLAQGSTGSLLADFLGGPGVAESAQTNNLPGTLLSLLQE